MQIPVSPTGGYNGTFNKGKAMKYMDLIVFVLDADCSRACSLIYKKHEQCRIMPEDYKEGNVRLKKLVVDMVPYGDASFQTQLIEYGIPHSIQREPKNSPHYHSSHIRFNDEGILKRTSVTYDSLHLSLEDLKYYIQYCKENSKDLYSVISSVIHNTERIITPIPWDNQERNAKIYRTKRMISNV